MAQFKERPYQKEAADKGYEALIESKINPIVVLPTGCHEKGHSILMYDGSIKPVEDINVGDKLMGPDSKPRTVLNLARGKQEMRKITSVKGDSFVVNLDHKLLIKKVREGVEYPCQQERKEVLTVREIESRSDWFRHIRKIVRTGVELQESQQNLPPYFVGLMLGDGQVNYNRVCLSTSEEEIISYANEIAERYNLLVREQESFYGCSDLFFIADKSKVSKNYLLSEYRRLGLYETDSYCVFIPKEYKVCSREQRLEILAGLIDSDGYLMEDQTTFEHSTVSKKLASDVRFIARSLGFAAYTRKHDGKLNGEVISDVYRTNIFGDTHEIPVKLKYKRSNKRNQIKDVLCEGFKIEKLPEDNYYGFELDGDKLYLDENFIVHHNTGKTIVLCGIADRILTNDPIVNILVLTHNESIIKQDYEALVRSFLAGIGIYSSGLNSREIKKITVAGIQTAYRTPEDFKGFDYVIVDEAHSINPKASGMYRSLFEAMGNPPVLGLTATPYRLGSGYIYEGSKAIFDDIVCDYSSGEKFQSLIDDGYLSPVIGKGTLLKLNVDGVQITGGDFNQKQLAQKVDREEITDAAVNEVIRFGKNYKKWLVFAIDINHAEHIKNKFEKLGISAGIVHSKSTDNRDIEINKFKKGKYRALVNVNVLTTGFDQPDIDLIAMMRPTSSPVIHVQTIGRGTRPVYAKGYDLENKDSRLEAIKQGGKTHCLVLDFGGNIKRLGPIDDIEIKKKKKKGKGGPCVKECPECMALNHIRLRECNVCGAKFDIKEKLLTSADGSQVTSGEGGKKEKSIDKKWVPVNKVSYSLHNKPGMPPSLKVIYNIGNLSNINQFICIEHDGYAKLKAKRWLERRMRPPYPETVEEILERREEIRPPEQILVEKKGKYSEVLDAKLMPEQSKMAV